MSVVTRKSTNTRKRKRGGQKTRFEILRDAMSRKRRRKQVPEKASINANAKQPLGIPYTLYIKQLLSTNCSSVAWKAPISIAETLGRGDDAHGTGCDKTHDVYCAMRPRLEPWAHQRECVEFMRKREKTNLYGCTGGMICDDMGMGKTFEILLHVLESNQRACKSTGRRFAEHTLIVCSKSLVDNWMFELNKFFPTGAFNAVTITAVNVGTDGFATVSFIDSCCDLVITTYPVVRMLYSGRMLSSSLFSTRWKRIVCDEAHSFVNKTTLQYAAMMRLSATSKWFVSGTPLQNYVSDLSSALLFVGIDERYVSSKLDDGLFETKEDITDLAQECAHVLDDIMLRRRVSRAVVFVDDDDDDYKKPEEVALQTRMPATVRVKILVKHLDFKTLRERETYNRIESRINVKMESSYVVHRLRQLCVSPILVGDYCIGTKIDQITDYIKSMPDGDKAVVFCHWVKALLLLVNELKKNNIESVCVQGKMNPRERSEAYFNLENDPLIKAAAVSTKIGGVGLNLTAANHVIVMHPGWNPNADKQSLYRVIRTGQLKTVHVVYFVMKNTVEDTHVMKIGQRKRWLSDAFVESQFDDSEVETMQSRIYNKILGCNTGDTGGFTIT